MERGGGRELQGRRPAALKVRKGKQHRKPPPVPQLRQPVIIYTKSPKVVHTTPAEFMSVVQRLTGASASTSNLQAAGTSSTAGALPPLPLPPASFFSPPAAGGGGGINNNQHQLGGLISPAFLHRYSSSVVDADSSSSTAGAGAGAAPAPMLHHWQAGAPPPPPPPYHYHGDLDLFNLPITTQTPTPISECMHQLHGCN